MTSPRERKGFRSFDFASPSFQADLLRFAADAFTVAIVAWVLWQLAKRLTFSAVPYDEEYFLWSGWNINQGLVPYKDFADFKPIGLFLLNALSLRVFGFADQRYRLFFTGLALTGLLVLLGALLKRRVARPLAASLVVLVGALWFDPRWHDASLNDAESLGMSFLLMAVGSLLMSRGRASDAIGGALLACSTLCKEPFALAATGTWVLMAGLRLHETGRLVEVRAFALRTVGGAFAVACALALYMVPTGALKAYVSMLIGYRTFTSTVCVTIGRWTPLEFWPAWAVRWDRLHAELVDIGRLWPLLPFYLAVFIGWRRRSLLMVGGAVLVTALGLFAVTLGGCFWNHYYMLGMTGLFAVCAIGTVEIDRLLRRDSPRLAAYASALALVATSGLLYERVAAEARATYLPNPPPVPSSLLDFIREHSSANDTIFTTGAPGVYFFSGRKSAVVQSGILDEFLVLYPGATDEERLAPLRAQLEARRPKVVILDSFVVQRKQRHLNSLVYPYLRDHNYQKISESLYLRPD